MFVVTVIFAGRENGVQLWFDDADAARKAYQTLVVRDPVENIQIRADRNGSPQVPDYRDGWPRAVNDHYGNVIWLKEPPAAVLMADHEKQLRASAACMLIQARVQADANDQAEADPVLRAQAAKARIAQIRQGMPMPPFIQG
jgi:hypothetical protein